MLYSVEQSAQHRAWRGAGLAWTLPQSSGRKFLRNLREKRSVASKKIRSLPNLLHYSVVESKICPMFAFYWVKNLSKFSSLFPLLLFKYVFLSGGRMRLFKIKRKKRQQITICLSQKSAQLCCATCLDRFLSQPFSQFLDTLPFFSKYGETTICIVFSAKHVFCSPTPKIRNTICEHNCANWFCPFFSIFHFGGGGLSCPFWGHFFLKGMDKRQKTKLNTKEPKTKQDHKMQTRKPLSLVTKKESKQHRHQTMQLHCLDINKNTRDKKQ